MLHVLAATLSLLLLAGMFGRSLDAEEKASVAAVVDPVTDSES